MAISWVLSPSLHISFLLAVSLFFIDKYSSRDITNVTSNLRNNEIDDLYPTVALLHHLCYWRQVRHFVFVARCKGYFSCRVSYHANSDRSFNLKRLILSGDICVNPGPEQCSVCNNTIARNHRAVSCDKCDSWCHIKCGNVLPKEYHKFQQMESFD